MRTHCNISLRDSVSMKKNNSSHFFALQCSWVLLQLLLSLLLQFFSLNDVPGDTNLKNPNRTVVPRRESWVFIIPGLLNFTWLLSFLHFPNSVSDANVEVINFGHTEWKTGFSSHTILV